MCLGSGEEEAAPQSHDFGDPDPFNEASFNNLQAPIHSTPAPAAPPTPSPAAPSLTEEQRKRMELNRQRALERRLARQQQHTGERKFISSVTDKNKNENISYTEQSSVCVPEN